MFLFVLAGIGVASAVYMGWRAMQAPFHEVSLQPMCEAITDYALISLTPNGKVAYWNQGAQRLLQYTAIEIIHQPVSRIYRHPNAAAEHLKIAADTGRFEEDGWRVSKHGRSLLTNVIITPILSKSQSLRGFTMVLRDITDRKAIEDRLRGADHAKSQFLHKLSHDLRTPLTPVTIILSQLLENQHQIPENVRALLRLEILSECIKKEMMLIDGLLDITRIGRGRMVMNLSNVDLHSIIMTSVQTVRADMVKKRQTVSTNLGALRHCCRVDAVRIGQVFCNLLRNSIKFTPVEGQIHVTTDNDPADFAIITCVIDTGVGMNAQQLEHLFEPFTKDNGNSRNQFNGFGLGLSIAEGIVRLHHGKISGASAGVNQGSTFTVRLPTLVNTSDVTAAPLAVAETVSLIESAPVAVVVQSPANLQLAITKLKRMNVLLVEDDAMTVRVLKKMLVDMGFSTVHVATSLKEANSVCDELEKEDQCIDLLLSDFGLPDGSGLFLLPHLRKRWPRVIGISCTVFGNADDMKAATELGYEAQVIKPPTVTSLRAAIEQAVLGHSDS